MECRAIMFASDGGSTFFYFTDDDVIMKITNLKDVVTILRLCNSFNDKKTNRYGKYEKFKYGDNDKDNRILVEDENELLEYSKAIYTHIKKNEIENGEKSSWYWKSDSMKLLRRMSSLNDILDG